MNILVPDSLLRQFLDTKATPKQLKENLSLCGPSIERIHASGKDVIYDIEVTTNRPDGMSVVGIAREAAAILRQFGIKASFVNDPYQKNFKFQISNFKFEKKLIIKTDPLLNPRWTSVVMEDVVVGPSPIWLVEILEKTGIRSINTIVDITNYLMVVYGQPAHTFDYDAIGKKNGVPTMVLRASKKGEKIVTLDGKSHTLPGDDIVIEDGKGRLIDLCGIMGAKNSSITSSTKRIILFLQTYDPMHIRKTSMALAHRTQASVLFEKGIDPELVLPALFKGVELVEQIAKGHVASKLYDFYPKPFKPYKISTTRQKVDAYLGTHLPDTDILNILHTLELSPHVTDTTIFVTVPSFRRDITIDVDIIEEISRIYGFHSIVTKLPEGQPPMIIPDKTLALEQEIKIRLRDWGYTELYTYSMISEVLMDIHEQIKNKAYKIANPLSNDWVYMRPSLLPSMLQSINQNIHTRTELQLFELSMTYQYKSGDLPDERPTLLVAWSGEHFFKAKGLAQALFDVFGVTIPKYVPHTTRLTKPQLSLDFGEFGMVGVVEESLLQKLHISTPVTVFQLDIQAMVTHAKMQHTYVPVPKFPPSFEDIALVVTSETKLGNLIEELKKVHTLITDITLLDSHKETRTLHVTYQSKTKNLTAEDIHPIREKLLKIAKDKFGALLKIS